MRLCGAVRSHLLALQFARYDSPTFSRPCRSNSDLNWKTKRSRWEETSLTIWKRPSENCLVRGICGSLIWSNRAAKFDSRSRRNPLADGGASAFLAQLPFEPDLTSPVNATPFERSRPRGGRYACA